MKYTIKIWSPYANNYFISFNYSNVDTNVDIDKGIVSGPYICIYNIEFICIYRYLCEEGTYGVYYKLRYVHWCILNMKINIEIYLVIDKNRTNFRYICRQ